MKKFTTVALSTALALSLASTVFARSMGKGMMGGGRGGEQQMGAGGQQMGNAAKKKTMQKACLSKRSINRGDCKEQFRGNGKSNRENAHKMVQECKNLFGKEKAECLKKQRGSWKSDSSTSSTSSTSSESMSSGTSTGTSEGSASSASSSY